MRAAPKTGEVYRHFKGNVYEIIAVARENDMEVDFVVHKGLHDGRVWTRSLANFLGDRDGVTRFQKLQAEHYCTKCCGSCESVPFHDPDREMREQCGCSWCNSAGAQETLMFVRQHFDPKATSVPNAQTCLRRINTVLSEIRTQTSDENRKV